MTSYHSSLNNVSSSSSSSSTAKSRRRRWTREQLLQSLQMLDGLEAPLPAVLPPSPPASRSASPAPGYNKRKQESSTDRNSESPSKRPRTGSFSARRNGQTSGQQAAHHAHHSQPPHSLQPPSSSSQASNPQSSSSSSRPEPEEGELREDASHAVQTPSIPAPPKASVDVPVRRPRRGKLASRHYDALHDTYHNQGRMLKYSGDARFWSTYPSTHREYRPLADPPPLNSPYHKHGGLIARLELVDALICFAYSMWNKEYHRRAFSKDTWSTIEAFLSWCKQKWQPEEAISETEKAFLGLIWMIEAFICGRQLAFTARDHLEGDTRLLVKTMKGKIAQAAESAENGLGAVPVTSNGTPIMLPSPASIAPANSANSTPTYHENGTPSSNAPSRQHNPPPQPSQRSSRQPSVPSALLPGHLSKSNNPIPPHTMEAMSKVTESIGPVMVQDLGEFVLGYSKAHWCMDHSQKTLTLPVMKRCFPKTFDRMMGTTLLYNEEHEPDIEDEEGELFWPGQLVTGEGLGWVCLMGKAMVKEFGKAYGYKGIDGVVPKPKPGDDAPTRTNPPGSSSHSSVTHGHR